NLTRRQSPTEGRDFRPFFDSPPSFSNPGAALTRHHPKLIPYEFPSRGEHFPQIDFGFHQRERLGFLLNRGTFPSPIRHHRSSSRSRTTTNRLISFVRVERAISQQFPSSHCVDHEIPSSPSDGS
ncbi:UNVERIFIED_CONTAM: hypothetical protein Sindi_2668300, partial [Sesamum indicum]